MRCSLALALAAPLLLALPACQTSVDRAAATSLAASPSPTVQGGALPTVTRRAVPRGEVYGGVSVSAIPGLGGSVHLGQVFRRTTVATFSFEMEATLQTLDVDVPEANDGGTWAQLRAGVKASFLPCRRGHPTARLGLGWFRPENDTGFVEAGDYVSAHLGLGYEWDLSATVTTGPEASVMLVTKEKEFVFEVVPQFRWHVIVNL